MKISTHTAADLLAVQAAVFLGDGGHLIWRADCPYGRHKAGQRAGWLHALGYRRVTIAGRCFQEHRVVFALSRGRWPSGELDHANGAKDDNRPENLREATRSENCSNKRASRPGQSGVLGVYGPHGKWRVRVVSGNRRYEAGPFGDLELAELVRNEAARRLHGEFARAA